MEVIYVLGTTGTTSVVASSSVTSTDKVVVSGGGVSSLPKLLVPSSAYINEDIAKIFMDNTIINSNCFKCFKYFSSILSA